MSRSKKIIGGAALIAAAIVVRTIVRIWRARRQPPSEASGAVSTAPGAYFPEGGPGTLQNEEGAPARSDLGEPDLGPPNGQPAPGPDTNPV